MKYEYVINKYYPCKRSLKQFVGKSAVCYRSISCPTGGVMESKNKLTMMPIIIAGTYMKILMVMMIMMIMMIGNIRDS